jgi:ribosomal protein S8E
MPQCTPQHNKKINLKKKVRKRKKVKKKRMQTTTNVGEDEVKQERLYTVGGNVN